MNIKVITNATPIIELAFLNRLDILWRLFKEVYVTHEVHREICIDSNGKVGSAQLDEAISKGYIKLHKVENQGLIDMMYGKLHEGELSVIVGAKELGLKYILMDEISGRRLAENFSLVSIGTLGILKLAKREGLIQNVKPILEILMQNNFRISAKLYNMALKELGEI